MKFDWELLDRELAEQLGDVGRFEIDRAGIAEHARHIANGRLGRQSNRVGGNPEPPHPGDVELLAELSEPDRARCREEGRAALERGEVAVAVLNGGMATRFGGVVKGIVEVLDGRTFLELKQAQASRHGPLPFLVMNSFATLSPTSRFLEEHGLEESMLPFVQSVSLRLTPDGAPFRDGQGRLSPYAPGHGDFQEALERAGLLDRLEGDRVRTVMLSNVDNLGADPDPVVIGYHLTRGRPLTVEVAPSVPDDAGGGPARLDGRLQILESFRLPEGFDLEKLPFVNTNTLLFSLEALRRTYPLTWFYVEKLVDGRVAVQIERLVGQVSAFVDAAYLGVEREGENFRYSPVKSPEDLSALQRDPVKVHRIRTSVGGS